MIPHPHYIRRATNLDVTAMIKLRTEAETWLREKDIRQWTDDYHDYARDVLRASVQAGTAWVVELGSCGIVATISVNTDPDLDFWGSDDDPGSALYLGKMIVARGHAGLQIGDAMMNWASLRAAADGKRWTRLDVRRDNQQLHRYYLARGWDYVRTVIPPQRQTESGVLFQRPAGRVTPAAADLVEVSGRAGKGCGPPRLAQRGQTFEQVMSRPNDWMVRE